MAAVGSSCYVEIPSRFLAARRPKQLSVPSGAVGKVETKRLADSAGGYVFKNASAAASSSGPASSSSSGDRGGASAVPTQNRYIHWKVSGCNLELTEECLDSDIVLGDLKVSFADAPILGDGISVVETESNVTILVATVASVHRLVFPHPSCLGVVESFMATPRPPGGGGGGTEPAPNQRSIFANAVAPARDGAHLHTLVNATLNPVTCASSWLSSDNQAVFALGTMTSSILLIVLPTPGAPDVDVTQLELKQTTSISRFWSGLVPSVIRGADAGKEDCGLRSLGLAIHPLNGHCCVFSVCQDHKLRVWSTSVAECVLVCDLLSFVPGDKDLSSARKPIMKKSCGSMPSSVFIAIYMRYKCHAQFVVFQPEVGPSGHVLHHVATLHSPAWDLVDFAVTNNSIWTVSITPEGENVVRYAIIDGDAAGGGLEVWHPVVLASLPSQCLDIPPHREPREVYLETLFAPEFFCPATLQKAIKIYRKTPAHEASFPALPSSSSSPASLREDVVSVVENEIHASAQDYELAEDEYRQLQLQCWARFYSQWLQYQEAQAEPLTIFADSISGLVGLVRKNRLSLLRSADDMERLVLAGKTASVASVRSIVDAVVDERDLTTLARALALVDDAVFADVAESFFHEIFLLESPSSVCERIVMDTILPESSLGGRDSPTPADGFHVIAAVSAIHDLPAVADFILRALDFAKEDPENLSLADVDISTVGESAFGRTFCGGRGVATLVASLKQMVQTRLRLLRNLLLLMQVALRTASQTHLQPDHYQRLQITHIPRASSLIQCYFCLYWIVNRPVVNPSPAPTAAAVAAAKSPPAAAVNLSASRVGAIPSFADFSMRHPASPYMSMSFGHGTFAAAAAAAAAMTTTAATTAMEAHTLTLAELFFNGIGGTYTRSLLSRTSLPVAPPLWTAVYHPMVTIAAQLLWPFAANTLFLEFLLDHDLHDDLLQYIRLLSTWCEPNASSRVFMQGECFLAGGKIDRAVDCFLEAAAGADKEDFLVLRVVEAEEEDIPYVDALYFLKILSKLESCGRPDVVVDVADAAIKTLVASGNETNVSTLYSLLFRHHLDAGHIYDAYDALISNPDPARRRDCLRQFLIILTEQGRLQPLVNFHYEDLQNDVVRILEARARATDVAGASCYYDLLYAFHVHRENYRQAAIIAYEQSERYAVAVSGGAASGVGGLQSRAKSLLAAMNALRLVRQEYQWILAPIIAESPINDAGGVDGDDDDKVIVELSQMERAYASVHALIQLAAKDPESAAPVASGPMPSPTNLVKLLMHAGLIETALRIVRLMSLPLTALVEPLVAKCIQMTKKSSDPGHLLEVGESLASAPHVAESNANPADVAWNTLISVLEKFDKDGVANTTTNTQCLRAIFRRVLGDATVQLPHRLVIIYKRRNAAELLKLFLDFDRVEEAVALTIELIDAYLGHGKEVFGLDRSLHAAGPAASVCVPATHVDQLRYSLNHSQPGDVLRAQLAEKLETKLSEYFTALTRASTDYVNYAKRATSSGIDGSMMES